jgi:hypothetical protein
MFYLNDNTNKIIMSEEYEDSYEDEDYQENYSDEENFDLKKVEKETLKKETFKCI